MDRGYLDFVPLTTNRCATLRALLKLFPKLCELLSQLRDFAP
jgi:hypothetical protein